MDEALDQLISTLDRGRILPIADAARASQGTDRWGLRAEFLQLVAAARSQVGAEPERSAAIAD